MKFKIGKRIPPPKAPKNIYRLSIEVMFGDADGDETCEIDFKSPLPANKLVQLEQLVRLLQAHDKEGHNEQIEYAQDTDKWNELGNKLGIDQSVVDKLTDNIPGDPMSDYSFRGTIQDWAITYFDEAGTEFEVNVVD